MRFRYTTDNQKMTVATSVGTPPVFGCSLSVKARRSISALNKEHKNISSNPYLRIFYQILPETNKKQVIPLLHYPPDSGEENDPGQCVSGRA